MQDHFQFPSCYGGGFLVLRTTGPSHVYMGLFCKGMVPDGQDPPMEFVIPSNSVVLYMDIRVSDNEANHIGFQVNYETGGMQSHNSC